MYISYISYIINSYIIQCVAYVAIYKGLLRLPMHRGSSVAAFDIQLLPAEMQHVRPCSDGRWVHEKIPGKVKPKERRPASISVRFPFKSLFKRLLKFKLLLSDSSIASI